MAPEVLSTTKSLYDASKADIWSFGVTLIELLKGRPPLHYLTPRAAMAAIPCTSPPRLESDDPRASKSLRELIHACLHDDPRKRPSASLLLKSFKSYFKQQQQLQQQNQNQRIDVFSCPNNSSNPNPNPNPNSQLTQLSKQLSQSNTNTKNNYNLHSETIYSQWDFDLSTFNQDGMEEFGGSIVKCYESVVDDIGDTDTGDTDTANITEDINIITEDINIITDDINIITDGINVITDDNRKNLKFRELRKLPKHFNSFLPRGGWEDKDIDISILPIPCPEDAPDLSCPDNK